MEVIITNNFWSYSSTPENVIVVPILSTDWRKNIINTIMFQQYKKETAFIVDPEHVDEIIMFVRRAERLGVRKIFYICNTMELTATEVAEIARKLINEGQAELVIVRNKQELTNILNEEERQKIKLV